MTRTDGGIVWNSKSDQMIVVPQHAIVPAVFFYWLLNSGNENDQRTRCRRVLFMLSIIEWYLLSVVFAFEHSRQSEPTAFTVDPLKRVRCKAIGELISNSALEQTWCIFIFFLFFFVYRQIVSDFVSACVWERVFDEKIHHTILRTT